MKPSKIKVLRALGVDVYRPKMGAAEGLNQPSEDERRSLPPAVAAAAIATRAAPVAAASAETRSQPVQPPPAAATTQYGAAREIPQNWQGLSDMVKNCQHCKLCETRTHTVFGTGPETAPLMIVGEGPGADEDASGLPFVGRAGKLLDEMLQAIGQSRGSNTYIANVVKCRPPGNRDPEKDEVEGCRAYLDAQIALLKPKLIVHESGVLREEAPILDLETTTSIGIRRSIKPATLPREALEFLAPRTRVSYFFERINDLQASQAT